MPLASRLAGLDGDLLFRGVGVQRVADAGHVLKHVIDVEHQSSALSHSLAALGAHVLLQHQLDGVDGLVGLADVDGAEGVLREVVGQIGAAVVEGEAAGQIAVADFLGPVVGLRGIFDGDVVAIGSQYVPLVGEAVETAAEDIDAIAEVLLEPLDEPDAVEVSSRERLVAGDDRNEFRLLVVERHGFELVVVEAVGA